MTDILSILSLSKDKYKDIIDVGLKSILSRTYSKYDKILFVGSIALPFLINLPMFEIIPNNPHKRIESFYNSAIDRIANVYHQIETTHSITDDQDVIRELADLAENNDKLCRILAKREVVLTLLHIIVNGEVIWKHNNSRRAPLTEQTIYEIYTTLDRKSLMLDCIDLLNHILPWVKDIPYVGFNYVINNNPLSPTSYRLTCAILRTMTLKRETIQPFISVGMIRVVMFYLANQVGSEYAQLEDDWLQIARLIYKDKEYYFKSSSLSTFEQSYVERYYKKGRFKLWILPTKELRISPFSVMTEIISDGIGYYQGWINGTALFMDHIYSDSPISHMIYRRLDSTLTRYLASSLYMSSLLLYFTVFLSRKGLIYYTLSTGLSMYQDKQINHQKLSGTIYRAFQHTYQNDLPGSPITMNMNIDKLNQNNIIKNRSDILNYQF
ncbi:hypothetical protein DFA_08032 [Cavenderia fasciculata]|uniref:Uncharacterized protein n=1 Tax=Cavenderia fasciculata TaxID=261658 RepID=F4Q4P2_CACFS|nr:uncharacterized protein DFA_08032 [Cavenderia fasciculata]EGG17051.1 hypothetical protein DFA_08032 [Cavenderia fasciculata]|eukprot:XP_004355535.1 hypothetical protein DFA_08032 [Cavenderia fasciculata]